MAERIPDLWKSDEQDATRLYSLFLAHLQMHDMHDRVVTACRQIRRFAKRGPGMKEAGFTFPAELDALVDLRKYRSAWRLLKMREELEYGKRLDFSNGVPPDANLYELGYDYAPVLFFLKRFDAGCSLKEHYLDCCFHGPKVHTYELLFDVYNDDADPSHRCRVTLSHFYCRLGKDLRDWRHWGAFINGLHPRLFRIASVSRGELLADSSRLPEFFDTLMSIRDERTPTRVMSGEADLIQSPAKVAKRQGATQKQRAAFDQRIEAQRERTESKLRELFPELQKLPK